jgi:hypothetical protein
VKNLMRMFVVLICSLALAFAAAAQTPPPKKEQGKKKGPPPGQVSQPQRQAVGKPTEVGKPMGVGKGKATGKPTEVGKTTGAGKAKGKPTEVGKAAGGAKPAATVKPAEVGKATGAGKAKGKPTEVGKPAGAGTAAGAGKAKATGKPTEVNKPAEAGKTAGAAKTAAAGKPIKPQHFNVPKDPNVAKAKAPPVKFQEGRHIEGSQNWQGEQYSVFRNYHSEWHDEGWWHNHYGNNIVFMFGAPYFLNAGYWYPAWGYNPNAYYAYDGPIYAANNMPPDQVIANVQSALQQQGYYHGDIDGLIGPETRGAIAAYQRDHGLTETAAIDQPTLQSLGMA